MDASSYRHPHNDEPQLAFPSRVRKVAQPDDTIMVMCRSGGRSAIAANFLAKAGFKNVYNVIDGMEGDANSDSDLVAQAQPLKEGWKNSGCPWTKKFTPERMLLPKACSIGFPPESLSTSPCAEYEACVPWLNRPVAVTDRRPPATDYRSLTPLVTAHRPLVPRTILPPWHHRPPFATLSQIR